MPPCHESLAWYQHGLTLQKEPIKPRHAFWSETQVTPCKGFAGGPGRGAEGCVRRATRKSSLGRRYGERLFGSWEMNWMAYNFAHDVALPGSTGAPIGFLMYPQAETDDGRLDCLDADGFKYEIKSREIPAANS
jgi:hypothetical protein